MNCVVFVWMVCDGCGDVVCCVCVCVDLVRRVKLMNMDINKSLDDDNMVFCHKVGCCVI